MSTEETPIEEKKTPTTKFAEWLMARLLERLWQTMF